MSMELLSVQNQTVTCYSKIITRINAGFFLTIMPRSRTLVHKIAMDQVISAKVLKLATRRLIVVVQKLHPSNKPLFVLALTTAPSLVVASIMTSFKTPTNFNIANLG